MRIAKFVAPAKDMLKKAPIAEALRGQRANAEQLGKSIAENTRAYGNQGFIENWVANKRIDMPEVPSGPSTADLIGAALTGALGGALGVRGNLAGQTLDVMGSRQQAEYANKATQAQNEQRDIQEFLKRSGGVRDDLARQINIQSDDLRQTQSAIIDDERALYKIDKDSRDRKAIEAARAKYRMDELEFQDRVSLAERVAEAQGITIDKAMGVVFARENKDIQAAEDNKRRTDAQISRIAAQNKVSAETAMKIAEQTKLLPSENHRKWEETRSRIERNKNLNKFGELNQLRKDYVDLLKIMEDSVSTNEKEVANLENQLGALIDVQAATGFAGKPAVDQKVIDDLADRLRFANERLTKSKKFLDNMKTERNDALRNAGKSAVKTATSAAGFVPGAVCTDATDCSMFAQRTMALMGLKVPPTTATQIKAGKSLVGKGGTLKSDLSPGDLVFFATQGNGRVSHVGVYVGDGKFRHASSTGKRGPSRNKGLQYMYKEEDLNGYAKRFPIVDIRRYSA